MECNDEQFQFASTLYDALFGLIIFFSFEKFLDITNPIELIFYLFSTIVIVHWWLLFKSASDMFGKITQRSVISLVLNILCLILIQYYVLCAEVAKYTEAIFFIFILFVVDLIWAIIWYKYLPGRTDELCASGLCTNERTRLPVKLKELFNIIKLDLLVVGAFLLLFLVSYKFNDIQLVAVIGFISIYIFYIIMTFKYEIIDLNII